MNRATSSPLPRTAPRVTGTGRERRSRLGLALEGFRFGPFRRYMGAIIWWNAAMSMQMLVRGYLAYQITGSYTSLGLMGLGSAGPMLLLAPLGGVLADRRSRRTVLQLGQVFSGAIAAVVAVLIFTDSLAFWHLLVASIGQGLMLALVLPSRQAFLPDVVGVGRLMNTIPLQTAGMNLMQILAPALGGFMIDWIGPGWVYVTMTLMFSMSVMMLFGVETLSPEQPQATRPVDVAVTDPRADPAAPGEPIAPTRRAGALGDLSSGFSYLRGDRTVSSIIAFSFLTAMLGMPIRVLLPGYAADVFGEEGSTLGILQMGMGLGALVGALGLASARQASRRGMLLAASSVLIGVALVMFSGTDVLWLAWPALLVVGIGSAGRQALGQVLVQEYVDDEYRGRAMALYMMQFSLMFVGSFVVSLIMEAVGPELTLASLGVTLVACTMLFAVVVPRFRQLN